MQASILRNFGWSDVDNFKSSPAEEGIAEILRDLYENFLEPLSDDVLFRWHAMIMQGCRNLKDIGCYRSHHEKMQVVSGRFDKPNIHFEAPPSIEMTREMEQFVKWFNDTSPICSTTKMSPLIRAGICHLYFVSIHPFEDGNGRIARALSEKVLSQHAGLPTLVSLSYIIEKHKKQYYKSLGLSNKSNCITPWLAYFSETILQAQQYTQLKIYSIIEKTKVLHKFGDMLNERQVKVIKRLFHAEPEGFKGGLSADNYIAITSTSRATATRDLQDLVKKEILYKTGKLKNTRYQLLFTSKPNQKEIR